MSTASNPPRSLEIATERLILRNSAEADIAAIALHANDPGVATMTASFPYPYTLEDARSFVVDRRRRNAEGEGLSLVIEHRQAGTVLGAAGLNSRGNGMEIGYWLGRAFWGQGFATEAVRALIDYGFQTMGFDQIIGASHVTNAASRRVMEKCGLRYVTSGLAAAPARGGAMPVDKFQLTRRDWQSFKAWRPATVRQTEGVPGSTFETAC